MTNAYTAGYSDGYDGREPVAEYDDDEYWRGYSDALEDRAEDVRWSAESNAE